MGTSMTQSLHMSLTRNTLSVTLPLSSILWLWFCKIPLCRGLASQARDAAPRQSSLVLSPPGDTHAGPSGATGRQEMGSASPACTKGAAPSSPLLGAWEWRVTFSHAEEDLLWLPHFCFNRNKMPLSQVK